MPEIVRVRESRYRDDRGNYSSDDERSSHGHSRGYKTVQRYRVASGRAEEVDEDRLVRTERLDIGGRNHHLEIDRRVEVDRIERPRSAMERYREPERAHESSRTVVYERGRDRPRDQSPESASSRQRDRNRAWGRERDVDVRVERHRDDDVEVERYQRETEYYSRPDPQPIVIRQRAPVVETAPSQGYEVVRREEIVDSRDVTPRKEEDYYYRRDVREVNPRREEVAVYDRRERRRAPSDDEYSDDEEVIIRKERKVTRSRSHSPYHKLHLAEGALAGAGAAALLANQKDKAGPGPEHRGRKIAGGAALGVLGAELMSRYRGKENRSRSTSRGNHTKLKTGLALAAAAVAAAAAGKYISHRNEKKEELARGRSRTRSISRRRASTGDYDSDRPAQSKSKHADPKHRAATMAKAGVAAAAVAGIAERLRSKSRGRSKSKLRAAGEIAATGLAGAAVAGLYENRKAKQEATEERRSRPRSRRRSRSTAYSDPGTDPELGMVQYGADPVYSQTREAPGYYDPAAPDAYDASYERPRRRDDSPSRSRSRSRVRDITSGPLAAGATAIGYDHYQKRKERREAERERRIYEEDGVAESYYTNEPYDDGFSPSPPRASGGAYYPNSSPPPPPPGGYNQHTAAGTRIPDYPPHQQYNAADYAGHPQQPPLDPYPYPSPRAREGENVSATKPHHSKSLVSLDAPTPQSQDIRELDEEGSLSSLSSSTPRTPSPPTNKSVTFAPLPPDSSRRLTHTRKRQRQNSDPSSDRHNAPRERRRRHHDPTRSSSPSVDETVEELPPRFDKDGRPLTRESGKSPEIEMVERILGDFEDVLEGRQTWRSLLRSF